MGQAASRVIPCLLLKNESLVKSVRFKEFNHVGDPINTIRIFNDLEVDELIFLDITASKENRKPNLKVLKDIASECFMPLGYGGGIKTLDDAKQVFNIGFEKIVINTAAFSNEKLIGDIANIFGEQAVVGSIDYKSGFLKKKIVRSNDGSQSEKVPLKEWALELEKRGAGEIILNSIDRDGTWSGYDLETISEISSALSVPIIASGGAGSMTDLSAAIRAGASAAAVGSMVVYQKKDMGVLINYPERERLNRELGVR